MASAKDMKQRAEMGMLENIMSLIEAEADKGRYSVDLSEYDELRITENIKRKLEEDDYEVDGQEISWG